MHFLAITYRIRGFPATGSEELRFAVIGSATANVRYATDNSSRPPLSPDTPFMSVAPNSRRALPALTGMAAIALLPLAMLALPAVAPAGHPQRLIVLLPGDGGDLSRAAGRLDAAAARPLEQSRWPQLWLVASPQADAASRLYAAGAWLVLDGNGLLAGCLGFRTLS